MLWHFVHGFSTIMMRESCDPWHLENSIVSVSDSHDYGPSCIDPVRHGEVRRAYWRAIYHHARLPASEDGSGAALTFQQLVQATESRQEDAPCLIWIKMEWDDILFFWWLMDAFERIGVPLEKNSVLPFPPRFCDPSELDYQNETHPLSRAIQKYCLRCWERFCGNDPGELFEAVDDSQPLTRELTDVFLEGYRKRFPRLDERTQRVCLSEYDRTILSSFHPSQRRLIPRVFPIECVNATTLLRVQDWTLDRYGAPLEPLVNPRGVNPYVDHFYRLTPYGQSLLADGIPAGMSVPPDPCGGLSFYDPENMWALDQKNRLVRL